MLRNWVSGFLLAVAAALAHAQGADVGLVNLVSGDVTFAPLSGAPGKVQAFMRVRDGDRINVPQGGHVRIVYFEGSRQERWNGPSAFRTGKTQGEPINGKAAEVQNLPASVPQRISRVPELMQNAKLGGIQVRGLTGRQQASIVQQETVREAKVTYERMRKEMPADDITPELFLYASLEEFLLYEDMKGVVDEMLKRQPGNEDVKALAAYVESRLKR